jgi:hypothetical protein
MFAESFSHYLSYGATDQVTVRELTGQFDGLLVPGTIAAFQREGTGGFVLTLSAAAAGTPYVIDPRFPLFQQPLATPKKSHISLAEIMGQPSLIRSTQSHPEDFTPEIIKTIAQNWASFNASYQELTGGKFDKYATRLGEVVEPSNAQGPNYVLAPYLMADGPTDPWWEVSRRLYQETASALSNPNRCVHVVAAKSTRAFRELLGQALSPNVAVWVTALDELTLPHEELESYARTIRQAASTGTRLFALYGGFFSVLLQNCGLGGSSHGIGYGEQRAWIELSESGPPPSRYYLPQLHRYMQPDEATRLLFADRRLASCDCPECGDDPPIALEYHSLMKHSVHCRAREIEQWASMTTDQMASRLGSDTAEYREILRRCGLPEVIVERTERQMAHLHRWETAMRVLSSDL